MIDNIKDTSTNSVTNNDKQDFSDDLLGDIVPEINPEKLFDENEYSTLVLGSENTLKKDTNSIHAIETVMSKSSTREEKDEALIQLKENKAQGVLVNSIEQVKKAEQKRLLIAACWETGLDFGNYFQTFIEHTAHTDYTIALEALTVMQEIEADIDLARLQKALVFLTSIKNPSVIITDAIALVEGRIAGKE